MITNDVRSRPVFVTKRDGALAPVDAHSAGKISRLTANETYAVSIKRSRNPANHRRLFALVDLIAERHPIYVTRSAALVALKLAAGHVEYTTSPVSGQLVAMPKSISFRELDDEEVFSAFFEAAIAGALAHLLPDFKREDIERAFEDIARFGA